MYVPACDGPGPQHLQAARTDEIVREGESDYCDLRWQLVKRSSKLIKFQIKNSKDKRLYHRAGKSP